MHADAIRQCRPLEATERRSFQTVQVDGTFILKRFGPITSPSGKEERSKVHHDSDG